MRQHKQLKLSQVPQSPEDICLSDGVADISGFWETYQVNWQSNSHVDAALPGAFLARVFTI